MAPTYIHSCILDSVYLVSFLKNTGGILLMTALANYNLLCSVLDIEMWSSLPHRANQGTGKRSVQCLTIQGALSFASLVSCEHPGYFMTFHSTMTIVENRRYCCRCNPRRPTSHPLKVSGKWTTHLLAFLQRWFLQNLEVQDFEFDLRVPYK